MFPKVLAIMRPAKGDPVLRIPAWFKRTGDGNNTPPATAATTAPPKAAVQHTPAKSKAAANPSGEEQNQSLESPPEPPEAGDWDPSVYEATSFPCGDTAGDGHAA
jgi:hypothetical protein